MVRNIVKWNTLGIFCGAEHCQRYFLRLGGLNMDRWSNAACCGYAIMAMKSCGFSEEEIKCVVHQLLEEFDFHDAAEAEQAYNESSY